jgi:hypothetical protein
VEHLSALGCTHTADVQDYFDWANRTLARLYEEAAKPSPSPSELTRLALRYALDARRPLEGDVGRFVLRRLDDAWQVTEYPSVAMCVPSIPRPGHLVKNVFAVGILDCLQQQPPAIYDLMDRIERLLGGVSAEIATLLDQGDTHHRSRCPKIDVDLKKSIVFLDGEIFPVSSAGAHFVHLVVSAGGTWISGTEMGQAGDSGLLVGDRPDRVRKKLPSTIRDLIESKGGRGFRLRVA